MTGGVLWRNGVATRFIGPTISNRFYMVSDDAEHAGPMDDAMQLLVEEELRRVQAEIRLAWLISTANTAILQQAGQEL